MHGQKREREAEKDRPKITRASRPIAAGTRAESELARLAPARGSQGFWGKILWLGSARRGVLSSPGKKKYTKISKIV